MDIQMIILLLPWLVATAIVIGISVIMVHVDWWGGKGPR